MPDPFTIRIFVPDGDPSGLREIYKMNWTGVGMTFPREIWSEIKDSEKFDRPGVYILCRYPESNDDRPKLYIGQTDNVSNRLAQHIRNIDSWEQGIVFCSTTTGGLNPAHLRWLEYALLDRAIEVDRCELLNRITPAEPVLAEAEKADTRGFLKEALQILPLIGLDAFEAIEVDVVPSEGVDLGTLEDTIVVPAHKEGFESTFLGDNCWHAIRIAEQRHDKIKFIAVYQKLPISAVTHYAEVSDIKFHSEFGGYKYYKVEFASPAKELERMIKRGNAPRGTMQSARYTSYDRLMKATELMDLFTY